MQTWRHLECAMVNRPDMSPCGVVNLLALHELVTARIIRESLRGREQSIGESSEAAISFVSHRSGASLTS